MAQQDFSDIASLIPDAQPSAATKPAAQQQASEFSDISALLPDAAPAQSGVDGFVAQYRPLAERVAKQAGVAPEAILGQWGLETGWGKSVIPGTNNLGNIKDFSGGGVLATDNMTGSRDAYRKYGSAEDFGDDFAGLLARRYKSAIGSGQNAERYFTALKTSGYAEDPDYVKKGVAATQMAARAMGSAAPASLQAKSEYGSIQPQPPRSTFDAIKDMGSALWQGAKSTARSVGATGSAYIGNLSDVELAAEAQKSDVANNPAALQSLQGEIARRKAANPNAGILDAAADVIGAALQNKEGMAQMVANQAPNSAVALGGAWAGGKAGAAVGSAFGPAGTVVGGVLGGLAGMFLGNAAMETGGKAIEKAEGGFTPQERTEAIEEGAVKAGVITAVDAATFKLGGAIASSLNKGAIRAGARAEAKVLADAGINIADGAEIVAALAKNPALRKTAIEAGEKAAKAASSTASRIGTAGTLLTTETLGEGVGEYGGELAATGQADPYDAALEAISSFSQSAPQAAMSMVQSASNRLDTKAIVAAAPEMAPVIEKAATPNSPLSRAAMAANTPEVVAQRQAERSAQAGALGDASAAEAAPAAAKDAGVRLAELEAIAKGTPSQQVTDESGNPLTIPGEPGRFFTQEEKAEYDQLVQMRDATEKVRNADKPQVDEISTRVEEISASIRENGTLQAMRDAGENTNALLKDLAIAKSKSTAAAQREQALARVEFALGMSDQLMPARQPREAADPIQAQLSNPQISEVDREELSINYFASKNQALPEKTRQRALERAQEIVGRYAAPSTGRAEGDLSPAVLADIAPQPGSPEEALRQAERFDSGAYQFKAEGFPDEAAELELQADAARKEAAVRREAIELANRVEQVPAPAVATPAGPGPAALRKRKATLRQLVDNGLGRVERRNDGFFLVSQNGRQEFKLDGMADAQLARTAIADSIRDGAAKANTNPTEGQKQAGNYKVGEIKFDGLTLAVENPQGSTRSGVDPNGERWETVMPANYGYIRGSAMAADGDKVDIYLPNNARSGSPAWIIDQYNDDGSFDETKTVLGVRTAEEATRIYDAGYSDGSGPRRRGAVTEMSIEDFKAWANSAAAKKPAGAPRVMDEQAAIAASAAADGLRVTGTMPVRIDGETRNIGLVSELPDAESIARGGRATRISKKQGEVLQAIAQAFGKRVQFFYEPKNVGAGDGFIMNNDRSTIYLNTVSGRSPIVVFGHELMHQLKRDNPEAHAAIAAVVERRVNRQAADNLYGKELGYSGDSVMEELISDIGGDLMSDKTFWSDVMDEVHAQNDTKAARKIIVKLADFLMRSIEALSRNLRSYADTGAGSKLVDDMTEIRAAFRGALADYIKQQGISKPAMQAEILKAGQDAKRSAGRTTKSDVQGDMFQGDMIGPDEKVATGRVIDSKGGTEEGGNVDSAGRQIAPTRQALENFWKWFGDSDAVDDNGRPSLYHHTTRNDFDKFEANRVTKNSGTFDEWETSRAAIFFTESLEDSQAYGKAGKGFEPGANVMPVYLKAENILDMTSGYLPSYGRDAARIEEAGLNPRYMDRFDWSKFDDEDGKEMVDALKRAGYDAVKFWDQNPDTQEDFQALAVFSPEQIKSALGNRGTFDSADANITRSASRDDALTVEAYHFSRQPRNVLSTGAYGSGLQGSDRDAIMDHPDKRLRKRLYFYVNKGTGVRPESGVGGIAHKAILSNIYDSDADAKRLKQGRDKRAFESAVLDAGYDGYLARLDGTQPGQVILLGQKTVEPEVLGQRTQIPEAKAVPQPAQRSMDAGDRIMANSSLPAGRMDLGMWSRVLRGMMPDVHAQLDAAGVFDGDGSFYKDELVARARKSQPIAAQSKGREAKIEKLAPVAQRGQRVVGQRVTLSADEKQAIEFSAETTGVSAKEITRVVREHKLAHPTSQGWAPLNFAKTKIEKGKIAYEYDKVPYSFNADADGRALKPGTTEYDRRVGAVARRMTDEVRRVHQRAADGDKNAENILAQAGWYKSMRARLRHEFGGLGDLFADLLGATSPNTPVRDNWTNAVDSLRRATRGDFDQLIPAWEAWADDIDARETELRAWFNGQMADGKSKKAIKESAEYKEKLDSLIAARELPDALLPTKETGKKYGFNGRNVARAMVDLWRVVRDADPDVKRGGTAPKAVNFSGNLIGFRERATIDVWAARMLQRLSGGLRVPSMAEVGVSGEMRADGATTLQFGFGQDVFSDAVKRIRKDPELKTNDTLAKINDDDLQAVVWFVEKEIWTANNWTSAAGEGGSFELEASLSGSAEQERIKELRRIIDSSKSKPDAKAKARAELAKLERTVDRFVGGLSTQMSMDTQGIDFVPQDSDMARLSNEVTTAIYEDDSATAVLASKALATEGRYGGIERSLDLEVVAREGYKPAALWKKMLEIADRAKQDSTFLSRVLRDDEEVDMLRHRPGVEIYFREAASREKLERVLGELANEGVEFLTVIVDGRRMSDAVKGQMPPAVGVRMQYVPEFDQRYGFDDLSSLDDAALAAKIQDKAAEMTALADRVAKAVGNVSFASQFWYETDVAFGHEYQEKIDAITTGSAEGSAAQAGGREWAGRTARAGLESANRQARETARTQPGGDVLDRNQAGTNDAGRPGATGSANSGSVQDAGGVRRSARRMALDGGQDQRIEGREEDGSLTGLPRDFNIAGQQIRASHWAPAEAVARKYMADAGLEYTPPARYAKVDPERAKRIAAEYDKLKHDPQNPQVKAAYEALARETIAQYSAVIDSGLQVEFIDFAKQGDPYAASPRLMTEDVRNNNHMWLFSTRDGFGSDAEFDPIDNPLLAETEFTISGQKALVNDLFRVVHDYFGHVKEGVGFRADGEENTWRAHSSMFSPLAQRALTTETRGQNSAVNFSSKPLFQVIGEHRARMLYDEGYARRVARDEAGDVRRRDVQDVKGLSGVSGLERDDVSVLQPQGSELQALRRPGNNGGSTAADSAGVPGRDGASADTGTPDRQDQQRRQLRAGQSALGNANGEPSQQANLSDVDAQRQDAGDVGMGRGARAVDAGTQGSARQVQLDSRSGTRDASGDGREPLWKTITVGEHNRTASSGDTHYADQKVGLLPQWVSEEGRRDSTPAEYNQRIEAMKDLIACLRN